MKINYYKILKKKILKKNAKICIIGLGYVGTELLKKFNSEGFSVIGIDKNKKKLLIKKKIKK